MPYINKDIRQNIDSYLNVFLIDSTIANPGELNYVITKIIKSYLEYKSKNYSDYNEVIGVLECAKLEFYRRAVSPYEDKKIKENGDVY